jgi:hypothetical protein
MDQDRVSKFEAIDDAELIAVDGGLLRGDGVVIIGCIPPFPPLKPGEVYWNPWLGQPYPGGRF